MAAIIRPITVFTIGTQRTPLSVFIGRLQAALVDLVVDVRLRNTSHLAGYTKRDDLAFLLRDGFGIAYEHHPELAPTREILDTYRAEHDWDAYVANFLPLLSGRGTLSVGRDILSRYGAPCLLCREPSPDQCHRRLVAEHWARRLPGVGIVHL